MGRFNDTLYVLKDPGRLGGSRCEGFANNKDPDQPAHIILRIRAYHPTHPCRLISAFVIQFVIQFWDVLRVGAI